ncbi:MAG: redoxin domain-containing protein [Phycisphaerales bacterium]|nr:redoxin domain-containing protein [Phycisphaerales bacterium]
MTGIMLTLLLSGPPADAFKVSAAVAADSRAVGAPAELRIELAVADGWEIVRDAPPPMVQIAPNPAIRLDGPEKCSPLTGFLRLPYEDMRETLKRKHKFFLAREPKEDDRVDFIAQAYIRKTGSESAFHVRRRVSVPLIGDGAAKVSADGPWKWGPADNPLLTIGDKAPDFTLKSGDGSQTSLSEYRSKKNVIIACYRAFW